MPLPLEIQRDGGLGAERGRRKARALQAEGQRHGEASRMRRCDELLGIGALLILEP